MRLPDHASGAAAEVLKWTPHMPYAPMGAGDYGGVPVHRNLEDWN